MFRRTVFTIRSRVKKPTKIGPRLSLTVFTGGARDSLVLRVVRVYDDNRRRNYDVVPIPKTARTNQRTVYAEIKRRYFRITRRNKRNRYRKCALDFCGLFQKLFDV